ncbi:MAG: glycosyltransferase [bacterium]|nr:glycosyltransferase [bacterium]
MASVLIFSSSSRGAHASAADALAQTLRDEHGVAVTVADLHSFLTPLERWFYRRGQFLFLNVTAQPASALVRAAQRSSSLAALARARYPFASSAVRALVTRVQPSVIVATHPLGAMIMGRFGLRWRRPLFFLPVNYEAHRFQVHPTVTTYGVPHELVAADLRRLGVSPEAIAITGMPLDAAFDTLPSPADARRALGLPERVPVVVVSQGAVGSGPWTIPLVVSLWRALPAETHILVITGHNTATARVLTTLPLPPRVRCVGFVRNFHEYLRAADVLIGKAGGMSATSAFIAGTPLVIFSPNALEVGSARRFSATGAALTADGSVVRAVSLTARLLASPEKRRMLTEAASRFVVHGGRQRFANMVFSTLVPVAVQTAGSRALPVVR